MDHQPTAAPAKLPRGHVDPRASVNNSGTHHANYLSHSNKAKAPVPISIYSTDADDYKQHRHNHRRQQQPHPAQPLYGECQKNHAAALGGHALDGCGEFMPSPSSDPALLTSLTCAACGCHRNFHRRRAIALVSGTSSPIPTAPLPLLQQEPVSVFQYRDSHRDDNDIDEDEEEEQEEEEEDEDADADDDSNGGSEHHNHRSSNTIEAYTLSSAAPHMLMALSAGTLSHPPPPPSNPAAKHLRRPAPSDPSPGQVLPRKRFRTRFSPEQKEKMHELSEHLGWRLQKRDEAVVEERCREIGVGKGVFKVWMHNNKHQNSIRGPRTGFADVKGGGAAGMGDKGGSDVTGQGYGNGNESNGGHTMVTGSCSSSPSPPRS